MRGFIGALLMLGLAPGQAALAAFTEPVAIDAGLLAGRPGRDASITVFRGIPYAASPVGDRRWRAPQPATRWSGVRKAEAFGPVCTQQNPPDAAPMSEDCLVLNVWTGASRRTARRPVLVWLHVFLTGSGSDPQFDGEGLARKGVVVVTLNYRIGPLGFLATPELSRESGRSASGNYGVLDQIAALQWVQKNIAAFGGDPANVTLAGMASQRGSSVSYLAVSPLAKGLFVRAISQSHFPIPSVLEPPRQGATGNSLGSAEAAGAQYQKARNANSLAELRALPWQQLFSNAGGGGPAPTFQPVVDGWIIPKSYNDAAAVVTNPDATYVAGNNLNEGGAPVAAAIARLRAQQGPDPRGRAEPKVTLSAYLGWAGDKFGELADEFLKLYPAATDDDAARQNNAVVGDFTRVATHLWSERWSRSASRPMYSYFWTHAPPSRNGQGGGAGHGSEISYALNSLDAVDLPWTDADRKIAAIMSSYWANIATNGNPNGAGLPHWPAFDAKSPTVMQLGERFSPMPLTSPDKLAFWQRFYAQQSLQ